MKLNDELINQAITALSDSEIVKDEQYNSEYKGYISSFGAAIIQSGLLPAIIFFENSSRGKSEKKKLVKAIVLILSNNEKYSFDADTAFSTFIINNPNRKKELEKDVNNAAIALKLALRTFKEIK